MIVVSDTSPILYLLLIGQIDLLPRLYQTVVIPEKVQDEMLDSGAPAIVREWISSSPAWLSIYPVTTSDQPALSRLDPGEKAAIALVQQLNADLLIVDDWAGRQAARELGIRITGLLGILKEASDLGMIDLAEVLDLLLLQTNFRVSPQLVQRILHKD